LPPSASPCQVILPHVKGKCSSISTGTTISGSTGSTGSSSSNSGRSSSKSSGAEVKQSIKAIKVSAGFAHSAALTEDGSVYVWGRGMSTECKIKSFLNGTLHVCEDQLTPRLVELPDNRRAIDICSSYFNLVILAEDRSLWAIGQ